MESSSQIKVTDYIKSSESHQDLVSSLSNQQTLHTPSLSKTVMESSQFIVKAVPQASSTQILKNIDKSVSSEVLKSYKDLKLDRSKRSAYATQSVMSDISSDKVSSQSQSKFTSVTVDLKTHVNTIKVKPTVQITESFVSKSTLTPTKADNSDSKTSISSSYSSKVLAFPNLALRQVQAAPLAPLSVLPSSSDNQMDTVVTPIKSQSVKDVLSSSDMKASENVSMVTPSIKVSKSQSLKSNTLELSTSFSKTDNVKQTTLETVDKLSSIKTNVDDIISSTTDIGLTPSETIVQTQIGNVLTPSETLVQLEQITSSKLPVSGAMVDKYQPSQSTGSTSVAGASPVIPMSSSAFVPGGGGMPPVLSSVIPPLVPVNPSGLPGSSTTGTPTPAPAVLPNSFALILGVSLCGVGMLLFLVTLTIVCCRKKRPAKKNQEELRSHDFWVSTTAASDIAMANVPDPLPNFENVSEGVPAADEKPNEQKMFVKPPRRRKPRGGINVFPRDPNEGKYRALYTFEVTQEGQLAFRKGDIIDVLEKTDEWWKGTTGGREGWFPGSYIREIRPRSTLFSDSDDNGKPEKKEPVLPIPTDKDTPTKQSVSSFLLSKDSKPYTSVTRSHSDRQSPHGQATPKRESWALGKEVSIPKIPHQEGTTKSQDHVDGVVQSPVKEPRYGSGVDGMKFKVMYHYLANFKSEINLEEGEIVTAYEKDKNGWMRGKKDRTGEEGWFPAVYVEECTKQDLEELEKQMKKKDEEKDDIYRKLDPNHNNSADHDWICIEHVAICPYAAEKTSDLSFDIGDKVLVFQTLQNGWWLGCRGDEVGWFPGAYVELVYEEEDSQNLDVTKPSQPAYESLNGMSTFSSQKSDRSSYLSVHSNKSDDELSVSSAASHSSAAETGSGRKPRPKRKAPKPPVSDGLGGSKLPTPIKPARPPPPQPGIHHSTPEHRDVSEALGTPKQKDNANHSVEITITPETSGSLSQKPIIPKRFVKPKLLKIPRRKLELHTASKGSSPQTRSPPPARPAPPKLLPPQYLQKPAVQNGVQDHSWSQDNQASPDSRAITQTWSPVNGFSLEHDTNTSSLENMSSFSHNISGINGTLDNSVNLSRDKDHDGMVGDSVAKVGEHTNKHSAVPKLKRQDAISSTSHSLYQEEDNANHLDQEIETNASPQHEKHNVSRIPQFNNGHASSPVKSSKIEDHDVLENHSIEDIKPPWEDEEFKNSVNNVSHLENDHELHEYLDDLSDPSTSKDIAKPPVAPKPKGIPPPKIHYKGSMSTDSANKQEQSRIPQESPSSRRKMSGQRSNVPASPTRERKSGLPVSKSSKLPRQKSSERPVEQKSVSGNEPERQNSLDDNSPSRSRFKPNRPGKPPDSSNSNKSQKLSDTSPSRLPTMKSFQSPNSVSPRREESKKTSPQKSNTKGKRSIPVAKPARPPPPNSPPNSPPPTKTKSKSQLPRFTSFGHGQHSTTDDGKKPRKSSLRRAVRSYQGQSGAELSFEEGSFITEISQDKGNSGWYIGMLADGTKGLYHPSLVEEISTSNMSTEV